MLLKLPIILHQAMLSYVNNSMEVVCRFPLALMYADKNFMSNLLRYACKNICPSVMRMSQCNFRQTIALEYEIHIVGCIVIRGKISVSIQ